MTPLFSPDSLFRTWLNPVVSVKFVQDSHNFHPSCCHCAVSSHFSSPDVFRAFSYFSQLFTHTFPGRGHRLAVLSFFPAIFSPWHFLLPNIYISFTYFIFNVLFTPLDWQLRTGVLSCLLLYLYVHRVHSGHLVHDYWMNEWTNTPEYTIST